MDRALSGVLLLGQKLPESKLLCTVLLCTPYTAATFYRKRHKFNSKTTQKVPLAWSTYTAAVLPRQMEQTTWTAFSEQSSLKLPVIHGPADSPELMERRTLSSSLFLLEACGAALMEMGLGVELHAGTDEEEHMEPLIPWRK